MFAAAGCLSWLVRAMVVASLFARGESGLFCDREGRDEFRERGGALRMC